jgi:hypothetical protein
MKYVPARDEDGLKPFVARLSSPWFRDGSRERLVWALTPSSARFEAKGRERDLSATVRRATPADMERLS